MTLSHGESGVLKKNWQYCVLPLSSARFSDGTVTNGDWKCYLIHYGPTNLATCLPNTNCNSGPPGTSCVCDIYSYDSDW